MFATARTTEKRVEAVLRQELGIGGPIDQEARLVEDLHADSLDQLQVVIGLEDEFEILITDRDAEAWQTVGDVTAYIEQRQAAA